MVPDIAITTAAVDLCIGRTLLLDATVHRITGFDRGGERLVLVAEDGTARLQSISRADLLSRLCCGRAEIVSPFDRYVAP